MFHTIDDSKEVLANLNTAICFATMPFTVLFILFFGIFRVSFVFAWIFILHWIPLKCGLWVIPSYYVLYHVDNVYWPIVYEWCVNVYDEHLQVLKTFKQAFQLAGALGTLCYAFMLYLMMLGITLVISLVMREATGVPMAVWAVLVLICLEPPYRYISFNMETYKHDLDHAWSVYKESH